MDHFNLPVTMPSTRTRTTGRLIGRCLIAIVAVLCVLVFDLSPRVPAARAPTAAQVQQARSVAQRTHRILAAANGHATLHADRDDLSSVTTLASSLGKPARFDSRFDAGTLVARASRPFGPIWINVEARVAAAPKGFPPVRLKIGDLPLGTWLSGVAVKGARIVLRWRGASLPPLDDLVRSVTIASGSVSAEVHFPLGSGFAKELTRLRDTPVDARLTAALYCRLILLDGKDPTTDLAVVVRRAFMPVNSTLSATEQNRAALVAIAMYAVSPESGRLAGDATERVANCLSVPTAPLLAGRVDLAKHWALSAALTASLGDDIGTAMGEWKELADSRAGGSGFSFVDLAADRAGIAVARRATDATTADAIAARLRKAVTEDLLPIRALALSEGLSDRQFIGKYRAIDNARFSAAKSRIDRVISDTIGRSDQVR